jgi:signal transduction histidine kinase
VRGIQEVSIHQPMAANIFSFKYLLAYFFGAAAIGGAFIAVDGRQANTIAGINRELEARTRELEKRGHALALASRHKSQFVANMSHELRTPLAAMLGYGELLQDGAFGELPEKAIRIVERVQANGKPLLGLINSVLDISKIEAGQFRLNLSDYSVPTLIETVRIATESLAGAKSLVLTTEVATDLPHGFGDEQRLSQVLLNLVDNAIKFTDRGEVRVTAWAR